MQVFYKLQTDTENSALNTLKPPPTKRMYGTLREKNQLSNHKIFPMTYGLSSPPTFK